MNKITLPQFRDADPEMRQLIQALELRFQGLEVDTDDSSTDALTQSEADLLYAEISHTHLSVDITDLDIPDVLSDLTDVSTSTPSTNDRLVWNGSAWAPTAPASSSISLDDLTDVDTSGVSDGEVLTYNSGSMEWEPQSASSGSLAGLSDTSVSPSAGDLLFYEGSNWEESGANLRWVDGSSRLDVTGTIRVLDSGGTDSISIQHDGTVGEIVCAEAISFQQDGVEELATQDSSAAGNTSGAVVMDDQQNSRDVGFNDKRTIVMTADITLDDSHAGARIRKAVTTTGLDIILPSSTTEFQANNSTDFWNAGNSTVNIDATTNSVTLRWFDGSTIQTGDRTLAYGAVVTIERFAATEYDLTGSGIT